MLTILPAAGAVLHVAPDLRAATQRRGSFSCRAFRELARRKDMNHAVRSRVRLRSSAAKPSGHGAFLQHGCALGLFPCVALNLKVAQMIATKNVFNNVIIMNAA